MRFWRWALGTWVGFRLFGPVLGPRFKPPQEHPWRLPARTVFVGDEEFIVREAGPEGTEPILLIHGLAGSSLGEWYQIGEMLAEERRVIMIDHRNHGLAPQAVERYEIEDVADDIAAVLDEMGLGAVHVMGYSMGGVIAQSVAYRHPGKVSKLVLVATLAAHPAGMRRLRQGGVLLTRAWERLTGLGTSDVRTAYLLGTSAVSLRHARWLWVEAHRRNPDAGAQATLALLRFDSRSWVGRLGVETLVVIPTHDLLVPPAWQYELAGLIPGAKIAEVVGARHEVVWSHSELVLKELAAFL